jgi:aryl-alcohol dehydrogenase-like predicted oxidoreductase
MKIVLGTAQFGLNYGVSNKDGKVGWENAKQILQYSYDHNVRMIDTATVYGNAEQVVGKSIDTGQDWKIITKIPEATSNYIDTTHVAKLRKDYSESLLNLKKKRVYGLLLHSCDDLFKTNGNLLFEEMERFKYDGLVKKIGVSVYNKNQIDRVLDNFQIDLIQLPINILDQSLIYNESLSKLKKYNVEIHARSVFLQGLLLMEKSLIPSYFRPIEKKLDAFYNLSKKLSLTNLELALGYVSNIDEIDKIVVGVAKLSQMQEIIKASLLQLEFEECRDIYIDNSSYTNPSLWKI